MAGLATAPSQPRAVAAATALGPHVRLLGAFELTHAGRPVTLPLSAQRVLAFVALHNRPLTRPYVAGSLWLDSNEERAQGNLRSALWRLRRPRCPLVEATCNRLCLASAVAVDVLEARALARASASGSVEAEHVRLLTDLAGDLLPDWYEDWVLLEQERFRQLRLHALECLCEWLTAAGRFGLAVEAGHAAVAGEPLRESAHRALIKVHLAQGNHAEAIRALEIFRRLIGKNLGVAPSPQIEQLVAGLSA
jgi:DNA-binding SARP family transcriptional activator